MSMDLRDVETLARQLMSAHGLGREWSFAWDRAKRRAGHCRFHDSTITLSRHLMAIYPPELVREAILHEIAHALVGPRHNHDALWRATARRIGASGSTRIPQGAPAPAAPWLGTCPSGHTYTRHRRPHAAASCTLCSRQYDPRFAIEWTLVR